MILKSLVVIVILAWVVLIHYNRQTLLLHAMHVCSDERNYELRRYRHTADKLLISLYF